ncbi:hypothetical protein SAMN05216390_1387 [Lachnospiraceae bacterium KH1T2]|nr:hypothetical protein SAMN05216390_1387 [Lachnospiraceae bacterium KH1T2]
MSINELQDSINLITDRINELILYKPEKYREEIYRICSDPKSYVAILYSEELAAMTRICVIDRREKDYMTKTVYDMVDINSAKNPVEQLKDTEDKVKVFLYRFEEKFDAEELDEAISYFIRASVSADYINFMVEDFIEDKERVLLSIANMMREREQLFTALRIYRLLYKKYFKDEYAVMAAYIYMQLSRNDLALKMLEMIQNPAAEVRKLIVELRKLSGGN